MNGVIGLAGSSRLSGLAPAGCLSGATRFNVLNLFNLLNLPNPL